jgi:hypothetical protein|nr:MAG TPA: hypothetical protein [Caudoviricetes sp.]
MASGSGKLKNGSVTYHAGTSKARTRRFQYYENAPKGWKLLEDAPNYPIGYRWYSNGKSLFSGGYKQALVKDKR